MDTVSHATLPPQSIEAEQSILGGLLLHNAAYEQVADVLAAEDFYRPDHRLIYQTIVRLIEAGGPADALTVAEDLEEHGKLDEAGGHTYLGSLSANTPSAANVRRYAEIVRKQAVLRGLTACAQEMIEACAAPAGADPTEIAGGMEARIARLIDRHRGDVASLGDAVADAARYVDELHAKGGGLAGLSTGFVDLDQKTGGLAGGDLVIVAGRPSMGKTALALNIAEHLAQHGESTVFFSLEMAQRQLALRLLADRARLSMHKLRTGRVSEEEWPRVSEAWGKLRDLPIWLDDTPVVNCAHIRARCRRIKRQHGLAMVVVDYLQLMRGEGDNRTQEVGSISRGLKGIAKELDVPVVALSQLSRRLEDRHDKRPTLSDLRDSGEIEQDADTIAFIYRDEVYHPDSPAKGTAEILVRKQRNGPTGDVRLCFIEELMRFQNYAGPAFDPARVDSSKPRGFDYKAAQAGN